MHILPCRQTHKEPSEGSEYFTTTSLTSESTSENLFQINTLLCSHGKMKINRVLEFHLFRNSFIIYIYCLVSRDLSPFKCTCNHRLSDLVNSFTSPKIRGQSFRSWTLWWGCGTGKATHAAQLGLTLSNIQTSPCFLCSHSCLESLLATNTETKTEIWLKLKTPLLRKQSVKMKSIALPVSKCRPWRKCQPVDG